MEEIIDEKIKLNDVFGIEKYDEAVEFIKQNEGTTIVEVEPIIDDENIIRQYQLVELPKPSLEELKIIKRAEINVARDEAEQGGFEYMGKVFDSDPISCIRISSAAQAMEVATMAEETPTITWTCQDNTTIDLTAADLMGLVVALAEWSNTCHQKATQIKALLEECQTSEEVEKISWNMELGVEKPEPLPEAEPDVNVILSK